MDRRRVLAVVMAVVGFGVVVAGIHQELLRIAPRYDETIIAGWGDRLDHEEYLLARLGDVGIVGALTVFRWEYATVLPVAVGGVKAGYSLVAVFHYVQEPGLYATVQTFDGTTRLILGTEPFLLTADGFLLLDAGVVAW